MFCLVAPNQTKPNQTKPNQTKPNQTKTNQTKPNQTKLNQTKQNQTKLNGSHWKSSVHYLPVCASLGIAIRASDRCNKQIIGSHPTVYCSNVFKHVQTCSKLFQMCSNVF